MTEPDVRALMLDALAYANARSRLTEQQARDFLEGTCDLPFDQLELDSLATMELCIAIEVNAGVSIVPDRLHKIGTLGRLAQHVRDHA